MHVQCPNFNSLTLVSLLAAIMSISYSTMAFGASVAHGPVPDVQYNLDGYTVANGVFGVWNSLGTVLFAYGGHNVVLEIQARPLAFQTWMATSRPWHTTSACLGAVALSAPLSDSLRRISCTCLNALASCGGRRLLSPCRVRPISCLVSVYL